MITNIIVSTVSFVFYLPLYVIHRMGIKHTNIISILGATSLQAFHDDSAWIIMDYGGTKNLQCVLSHEDNDIDHVTRLR